MRQALGDNRASLQGPRFVGYLSTTGAELLENPGLSHVVHLGTSL